MCCDILILSNGAVNIATTVATTIKPDTSHRYAWINRHCTSYWDTCAIVRLNNSKGISYCTAFFACVNSQYRRFYDRR
jgi:hypothetical protein